MIRPTNYIGPDPGRVATVRALAALLVSLSCMATCGAREQSEEFAAGMRERGLHELALDYLAQMETSPLADAKFRERIPYHRGVTLVAQARQTLDADQRAALFEQAGKELQQFVIANPESPSAAEALLELANVLVEQAKQLLAEATQIPEEQAYTEQRQQLLNQARGLLADAQPKFRDAERIYSAALKKIPKTLDPNTQSELIAQRQEYRGRLAQVSVLAAQAQFEAASTYPGDSDEFTEHHSAAAKQLAGLYEKYSRWLVGFYARLYEGRCYQALGDYQRALGCYEELISQSSVHPAFRKLIASAYGYQAECLIAQGKFDLAISNLNAWLKDAHDGEAETPEWLMVRFQLAEALRAKAESADTKQSERRGLVIDARDVYRLVAATPNEFQNRARTAAAALGPDDRPQRATPRDFAAAYEAGKDAMASVNAAKLALPSAAKNNPAAIPELRMQMDRSKTDARRDFRLALSLVDDDTDREQLNEVRYYLCWLYWENGEYHQAAVLGDFLARRYPEHLTAAASAKLALASYERLQQTAASQPESRPQNSEFEARKMAEIAQFMTRRWPSTPAAETAYRILINYAIRSDRIDEAKDLLEHVSPSARPVLESQLGNAMWAQYLDLSQRKDALRLEQAELDQLRGDATKLMQAGHDAARKSGKISEVTATASLYLAQALLAEGDYTGAIKLLEDPKIGPMTLVRDGHEAVQRPEYAVEVYKVALRAYVSVTPPQVEKAIRAMKGLELAASTSKNMRSDQLLRIYVSLAKSLNDQLTRLREAGRHADVARLSDTFGEFLSHIDNDQESGSWATRYWIAQTYFTMGESLQTGPAGSADSGNGRARGEAQQYFVKARAAFEKLANEAEQDPSKLPSPTAKLAVQKQLGECYRELGEYKKALDAFSGVLAQQESQLSVQQSAAQTYQLWGSKGGGTAKLERAIHGGYKLRSTGKNRIWGWLRLALVAERAARSDPKYEAMFFEARLEAARCRYLVGMKSQTVDREKNFATAKQSIRSMLQLYPELGGTRWRKQFEGLLKQIQQAAGDTSNGFKEFAVTQK